MSIKAVLFDLDGTLLPLDNDTFINDYFKRLVGWLLPYGYEPKTVSNTIWRGTVAMVKNEGAQTNESVFWQTFSSVYGEKKAKDDEPYFDAFYNSPDGFDRVREVMGFAPLAKEAVSLVKELGMRPILATNPVFPAIATEKRICWAGLSPSDFELYTTYENCRFCKPNVAYYEDIIKKLGLKAEECLMVGNDVTDDMIAATLGMKVFLLTDCLINKTEKDISDFPNGDFESLIKFLKSL